MGRRKIDPVEYIPDEGRRNLAYSKRMRGIFKKCIELSKMCDQYISMTIFDKNRQKLVQYSSHYDFNPKVVSQLMSPVNLRLLRYKTFCNQDYDKIANTKQSSKGEKDEESDSDAA